MTNQYFIMCRFVSKTVYYSNKCEVVFLSLQDETLKRKRDHNSTICIDSGSRF